MKAVILAAGEGKRLKPITATLPKPLIPLAGKPLLEHTIRGLEKAGIDDILLVVGYKEELIRKYFGNGANFGLKIQYITQEQHLGTAHAMGYAKDFITDDNPFMMLYGDILVDSNVFYNAINKFRESEAEALISLIEVDNPQEYGIISLDPHGFVEKITEKPSPDLNLGNLANAGIFIFNSLIFNAIEKTKKSIRGEYEFTNSMEILVNELNENIFGYVIKNYFWSDIGLPWQFLEANGHLLENLESKIHGTIEENVHIEGNIFVGKNSIIKSGSYIQGPCYIGENNLIGPNAFIRPSSFIADNCHIGMSEIKNSIIFSNSAIPHFNYIGDSIICENVNLGAGTQVANLRFDDKSVKVKIKGKILDSKRRKLGTIIGPNVKTGINVSIMCGKVIGENSRIGAHTLVIEDVFPNTLFYHDPKEGIQRRKLNKSS